MYIKRTFVERNIVATLLGEALILIAGTILLTASAKAQVPFYPVPMSLQTLVVVGLGLFLGPVRGSGIVIAYILQGLAGFPVFAGTPPAPSGLAYVAGPTGGYLAGFAISAFVAGWLARKGYAKTIPGAVTVAVVATALIYAPGLAWLGVFTGYGERLLTAGFYPFLLGDLVKSAIAGLLFIAASTVVPGLGHKSGRKPEKK
ncbi:biotin transporter BioY [Enterovirga aerilata]|uniref:Biotin transporter n=1 Tax=Enterovirga aerilata TaxID=2730920 RepID=A0A849I1R5_9HYPH|nr:biotin transporter BioY [Enterovirga sp. DB1703]NNM73736.1 biotin transporter BioY [Enterovirga sp. DB1703]